MSSSMQKSRSSPCQKQACAIQDCLARSAYTQEKCVQVIQALRDCCDRLTWQERDSATACELAGAKKKDMKQI